jgi:hypothetical protein
MHNAMPARRPVRFHGSFLTTNKISVGGECAWCTAERARDERTPATALQPAPPVDDHVCRTSSRAHLFEFIDPSSSMDG